jgi:hypothetical protein
MTYYSRYRIRCTDFIRVLKEYRVIPKGMENWVRGVVEFGNGDHEPYIRYGSGLMNLGKRMLLGVYGSTGLRGIEMALSGVLIWGPQLWGLGSHGYGILELATTPLLGGPNWGPGIRNATGDRNWV